MEHIHTSSRFQSQMKHCFSLILRNMDDITCRVLTWLPSEEITGDLFLAQK